METCESLSELPCLIFIFRKRRCEIKIDDGFLKVNGGRLRG